MDKAKFNVGHIDQYNYVDEYKEGHLAMDNYKESFWA